MTQYLDSSIDKYLNDLSAKKITPGGGSAAALTAALGAALSLMVINYSIRKGIDTQKEDVLLTARTLQMKSLNAIKKFIDEDCRVFEALMKTLSEKREAQNDYVNAANVPLAICLECRDSIEIILGVLPIANRNLISDIKCATEMLLGAFCSAKLNVEINLERIFDKKSVHEIKEKLNAAGTFIDEAVKTLK
ncbi:MAG: cyclodeaminase/cyclohydrolase family protein [Candidatus Omnitrophica bacterium]|nr:cyclodeaminase/cyclohydrolase family protein [Candidatus Omnitrophota bacterium]